MTKIVAFMALMIARSGLLFVQTFSPATRWALGATALAEAEKVYQRALEVQGDAERGSVFLAVSAWLWELEDSSPCRKVRWADLATYYDRRAAAAGRRWTDELRRALWPN